MICHLTGIVSKLDHFVDLKIETIHLTPIYETSSLDMGYDITDYYEIDSRLGSMEDFDELVKEMKKRSKITYPHCIFLIVSIGGGQLDYTSYLIVILLQI